MERRRELRFQANEPVVVTALGSSQTGSMGGMIQDLSGNGMLMKLPHSVARSALVRVETGSMLLLGEVMRSDPDGEGFLVAITVRHSLRELQHLEHLNRAVLGADHDEAAPVPRAPIMRV